MTKIIQRHDTAANWASVNPVLAQGEMGIEDDTRKFKFGDGTTAWADLEYASSEGGGGTGGTSNYNDLTNKPTINTLELQGELALGGALKIERASTDAFYNSARNSSNQLTFSKASGYFARSGSAYTDYKYVFGSGGLKINGDGTITPSSYFMMPYKLGDILMYSKGQGNSVYATVLYGYKLNRRFKPVLASSYDSHTSNPAPSSYTPFLNIYQWYGTTYYKDERFYTNTTLTPDATYKDASSYPGLNTSNYYMASLIYDEALGIYKEYYKIGNGSFIEYQFNTVMNEELQKVDTVMVLYGSVVTDPSAYTNFEIKDGSTVTGNFLTDMTYPEVMALPSVEVPEVIEHNVLSTGNIPNSYVGLDEKPKINGNELVGDINSTDLNIQRVMTPNGGINIVQNGDWHFFDASYDDTTKQITFNRYNLYTGSNNNAYQFASALNSTSGSKIGTYVDAKKIIPTCGVITPFYKNVTWKFGYTNYSSCNRLIFGNYVDGYFYPKYAILPLNAYIDGSGNWFIRIDNILESNSNVFSYGAVPINVTKITKSNYYPVPIAFITILYDNNTYVFKYTHQSVSSNAYSLFTATVKDYTEELNSCTHCWHIPNNSVMGYNCTTQLATGDWSLDCFNTNMDDTKLNNALILPDSGSNVFTTSISIKTDGVTTKINDSGQLEAIAPANMITTDNIASDATISTMSGNITTLTENMGGMKLVKITQTDYDALATKDENTLYIITG